MEKIRRVLKGIGPLDKKVMESARQRQDRLTKPQKSLGVLEELSMRVAGIMGDPLPKIEDKAIIIMVGDHGVVEEGVSAYPREVTGQMVYNFVEGGAGINVCATHAGARVVIVDAGIADDIESPSVVNKKVRHGTDNITKGPAMSFNEAVQSIEVGISVVEEEIEKGLDIIGTGDMGIGNTTPSSALTAVITGADVRNVTGRGTGINDSAYEKKIQTIEKALSINNPDPKNPIDVLAHLGGFEIGGICGVILAGAAYRIPVVIDGFISGAAALIAAELAPQVRGYMIPAHCSREIGHKIILDWLGLIPLFSLDLCLGEGTGSALGVSLVDLSCKLLTNMSTFADAGVCEAIKR
jgi:nicotinate-nucleotide--dimethylbenzimidazole phosphoribosyltransferase